jgi:REP element-mobilizing transposase RayT
MPSNPKVFLHDVPYEICTSVQTGLPLVATAYMRVLIEGILAAAQCQYPVTICHYVVMANHIHLIIIVKDPSDVSKFMGYLKSELAHSINRLLGRTGQSFWMEGYDSVMILSPEKLLERMEYIYLNPTHAGLVRSIERYPGLNTYNCLSTELTTKTGKKISRDVVGELPEKYLNKRQREELASVWLEGRGLEFQLKIEPWAWLQSYESSRTWDVKQTRIEFLSKLKAKEQQLSLEKKSVIGAEALESQDIRMAYKSKRSGKKMLCMSHCPDQRRRVIDILKTQIFYARQSYQMRKAGKHNALPPPGFFLPGGALLANAIFPLFHL